MRGNDEGAGSNRLTHLAALAVLIAMLTGTASPAGAQDAVRLSGGVTLPVSGQFGPEWTIRPGIGGQILLPMYGGETRLSMDLADHDASDESVPEFTVLNATLGWGPVLALGPVRIVPGAEVGANRLFLDDDGEFGANASAETEVLAGAYLRAGVPVAGHVEAWAEGGVRRTFFSTIATTTTASAGLAVRL